MISFIQKELRKYPELDTIRFIAVTLVVSHHLFYESNVFFAWNKKFGWIGVDIFFTLSGFLITSILLSEIKTTGTVNLKNFIFKRMLRLWPSWLIALTVSFGIVYTFGQKNSELLQILYSRFWHYLFHFANYSHAWIGKIHTVFSHYWSLAVEEHFYLLWPCLLYLFGRSKQKMFITFCLLLALPYLFRVYHSINGAQEAVITFSTHTRIDAIVWGCLLAYIYPRLKSLRLSLEIGATIFMFIFYYIALNFLTKSTQASPWLAEFGRTLISLGTVLLIIIAMKGAKFGLRFFLKNQFLSWLGIMSYGVYLFHFFTNTLVFGVDAKYKLGLSELQLALLIYTLPYLPAMMTYYFIDKKIHHLKNRLN